MNVRETLIIVLMKLTVAILKVDLHADVKLDTVEMGYSARVFLNYFSPKANLIVNQCKDILCFS